MIGWIMSGHGISLLTNAESLQHEYIHGGIVYMSLESGLQRSCYLPLTPAWVLTSFSDFIHFQHSFNTSKLQ